MNCTASSDPLAWLGGPPGSYWSDMKVTEDHLELRIDARLSVRSVKGDILREVGVWERVTETHLDPPSVNIEAARAEFAVYAPSASGFTAVMSHADATVTGVHISGPLVPMGRTSLKISAADTISSAPIRVNGNVHVSMGHGLGIAGSSVDMSESTLSTRGWPSPPNVPAYLPPSCRIFVGSPGTAAIWKAATGGPRAPVVVAVNELFVPPSPGSEPPTGVGVRVALHGTAASAGSANGVWTVSAPVGGEWIEWGTGGRQRRGCSPPSVTLFPVVADTTPPAAIILASLGEGGAPFTTLALSSDLPGAFVAEGPGTVSFHIQSCLDGGPPSCGLTTVALEPLGPLLAPWIASAEIPSSALAGCCIGAQSGVVELTASLPLYPVGGGAGCNASTQSTLPFSVASPPTTTALTLPTVSSTLYVADGDGSRPLDPAEDFVEALRMDSVAADVSDTINGAILVVPIALVACFGICVVGAARWRSRVLERRARVLL